MKILIITMNIGKTAPGIIFERLIFGLAKHHEIDVITASFDPNFLREDSSVKFSQIKYIQVHPRIQRLFISVFCLNPFDFYWFYKVLRKIKSIKSNNYDFVLSFVSFHNYAALIAGSNISKTIGCKYMAHLLDAIPPPIGWIKNDSYFRGLKKMMSRYLSRLDAMSSTNHQMLKYQINISNINKDMLTDVFYNPNMGSFIEYPINRNGTNIFIYTGGIYGPRKPYFIITAFVKLLSIQPDSKLLFIGTELPIGTLSSIDDKYKSKIEVHPYTKDLTPYYSAATALIDIDAVLDDDVYISSKIVNYININRIIILETGHNSPSHQIFKGIPSILECYHDSDEIFEAMKKSIQMKYTMTYSDRMEVRKLFQLEEVTQKINSVLNKIVNK